VGDRLGWNEKTKVVAKLQRPGSGPPAREPSVSEEERKAMMAHYFKRQVCVVCLDNGNCYNAIMICVLCVLAMYMYVVPGMNT
jgi:hypothetical protein